MEAPLTDIDRRLQKIEERNKKVEEEKAWEVSWTRRTALALFTYLIIALLMIALEIPQPWVNAIIPAVALLLSGPTLNIVKEAWLRLKR